MESQLFVLFFLFYLINLVCRIQFFYVIASLWCTTDRCIRLYSGNNYSTDFLDTGPKQKFTQKGMTVEFVGEAQEDKEAISSVLNGKVQQVYISPESLLGNARFRAMMLTE